MKSFSKQARSAAMRGGMEGWGRYGSADTHIRYAELIAPKSRRRCGCGCGLRATHRGAANGVTLRTGCEMSIRRWVKSP